MPRLSTHRRLAALAGCALAAATAAADLVCPEVRALSDRLVALQVRIGEQQAELAQAEAAGPDTLAAIDALHAFKQEQPARIAADEQAYARQLESRRAEADRNQASRRQSLTQRRDDAVKRHRNDHDRRQRDLNTLLNDGPPIKGLQRDAQRERELQAEVAREKQIVIAQLREGLFCSRCDHSKFEIEKDGRETFEGHLQSVGGHAVMRPEKVKERELEYDNRIDGHFRNWEAKRREIDNAKLAYDASLARERAALAQLDTAQDEFLTNSRGEEAALDQQQQAATADFAREKQAGEQRFANQRAEFEREATRREAEIQAEQQAFEARAAAQRDRIAATEAERQGLDAQFTQAAAACRARVEQTLRTSGQGESEQRRAETVARTRQVETVRDAVRAQEQARRAALAGGAPVAATNRLADLPVVDAEPLPRDWQDRLGLRENSYYQELPQDVRDRIDRNVETFSSPIKTLRAVTRDSLGRLRAGTEMALLNNALRRGNGLAPDLAAAVENAAPSYQGTVKRAVMPTIEALAVEGVVEGRELQEGRTFDDQEKVAERGFARTWLSTGNLKKHFNHLLETYNESMDTFMRQWEEDQK